MSKSLEELKNESKIIKKIIKGIWDDIYGRSGGDHFLDCSGDEWAKETQKDIKESWSKIIGEALKDYRRMK